MKALAFLRRYVPIFVALGVFVVLGHIFPLPATGGWPAVGTTDSRQPGGHNDAEGSHVASCDATLSGTAQACAQPTGAPAAVLTNTAASPCVAPERDAAAATPFASRRAPDRAVFLLNASFLI
jgi:hypothetical protein